jgi:Ala-tRNA(Pro) deacylase
MISQAIKDYLQQNQVGYSLITHPPAYTASQTAQAAHVPGRCLAKIVMVKIDEQLAMVVLPANMHVNFNQLKAVSHAKDVHLAREFEFNSRFPDCDVGAMPPFGDPYGLDVYLAESLSKQDWVVCNGGTHYDLLKITAEDLVKLAHPTLLPNC